jgi:hypothetical protein
LQRVKPGKFPSSDHDGIPSVWVEQCHALQELSNSA